MTRLTHNPIKDPQPGDQIMHKGKQIDVTGRRNRSVQFLVDGMSYCCFVDEWEHKHKGGKSKLLKVAEMPSESTIKAAMEAVEK